MQRTLRRSAFTVVVVALVLSLASVFGVRLLSLAGFNLDSGAPRRTELELPNGFSATVFASGLAGPRFMAVSPDGVLLVAERGADRIVALPDRDGDGHADGLTVVGVGYDHAHSVAFAPDGSLLVAGSGTLFRVTLDADLREIAREVLFIYPSGGEHTTRTVAVASDGSLLLSIGSSCNVCWEDDPERASIIGLNADGTSPHIVMRGLRNAVGVAVDPVAGAAWATNNGRDMMGDDSPPETLYRIVDGTDAGWPRCHAGDIVDPQFGTSPDPRRGLVGCDGVAPPAATFQAHAAPLGIAFWRDHAVIAFHGSWNRSSKVGYQVLWLPWADGPAGPADVLLGGFLDPVSGDSGGRPVGVTSGADAALYVSDDKAGFIYRVVGPGQ